MSKLEAPDRRFKPAAIGHIRSLFWRSARERPAVFLTLLAPVYAALLVALVAAFLPALVTVPIALVAAIPAAVIAWGTGSWVAETYGRHSDALVDRTRTQLEDLHELRLRESGSPLYAEWYFALRLEEEIERARRYGLKLSLLLITPLDSPSPATVKNRCALAQELPQFRASDLAGGIPGGGLAVLLANTAKKRAQKVMARLESVARPFGYTVGLASFVPESMDRERFIEAALQSIRHDSALELAA